MPRRPLRLAALLLLAAGLLPPAAHGQAEADAPWVVYEGTEGPGVGTHLVFVSGDEEYRSEEALPMLARILAYRHGFTCTVLFAVDPATGAIDPAHPHHIPGLARLADADLLVLFTRFRELPDDQMRHLADYTASGRPIIGLRTATHAFRFGDRFPDSPYAHFSFDSDAPGWDGGWGRQVLGETWIDHHGEHGAEGTRGLVHDAFADDPILNGVGANVYGPTDVYGLGPLPPGTEVLLYGQTLHGLGPDAPPNYARSIVPLAWRRHYTGPAGRTARVFATTMGASQDFQSEGLRRLLVNAVFWALDRADETPEEADVRYVGPYRPTAFGFGTYARGVRPADHVLSPAALADALAGEPDDDPDGE